MAKTDTLSADDHIAALKARQAELSPEQRAELAALGTVQETRDDVGDIVAGDQSAPADQPVPDQEAADEPADLPDLSAEQMTELLEAVEHNFNNHPEYFVSLEHLPRLEEGVAFAEVQTCLENDPALAKQVYAMLKRNGRPDVWSRHGKSFLFFESVQNTTRASRNCVYGKAQAAWLEANRPNEKFNGSVEKQREDMGGVGVVAEQMWQDMQELGPFTNASWEWTDSDDINDGSPTGLARYASRRGVEPLVGRYDASVRSPAWGWRAVAKGSES